MAISVHDVSLAARSSIMCPDGRVMRVRSGGSGTLPCVLIHGFGEGAHVWNDLHQSTAAGLRLIAVDLCGHGDSSWDTVGRYDVCKHVQEVLHVLDSLELTRFVVMGHSLGGSIAARIAAAHAQRVAGLVIVDTHPDVNVDAREQVRAALASSLKEYASVRQYAAHLEEIRPLASPKLLREFAAEALRRTPAGTFVLKLDPRLALASQYPQDGDKLWEILEQVSCPTLIVRGEISGVLLRPAAAQMVRVMRNATLKTVSAAGHSVMTDNPQGFREAVEPFLWEHCVRSR